MKSVKFSKKLNFIKWNKPS